MSIIIPSKNSERTIAECLESIASQTYRRIEVIVVDGFSSDSTRQIAQAGWAHVELLDEERSVAKNLGAKLASGEYLYFLDADCRLDPDTVALCVEIAANADGVLTRNQDIIGVSRVSRMIASRRNVLSADPLSTALRFVRKKAFETIGGFDADLYVGEDLDFQRRFLMRGLRMRESTAREWHLGSPTDFRQLLNRCLCYSSNYPAYASKNPKIALRRMNIVREIIAWKKSNIRTTDLPPVLLLGFLSEVFLMIGVLFNLSKLHHKRK